MSPAPAQPHAPSESAERNAVVAAFIHNVTFAAQKPKVLGVFWSAVTSYPIVEARDDYVRLQATDNRSVRCLVF